MKSYTCPNCKDGEQTVPYILSPYTTSTGKTVFIGWKAEDGEVCCTINGSEKTFPTRTHAKAYAKQFVGE